MKATKRGLVLTSKRKLLTLAVASCFAAELAYANPTGPSVAQGQATVATQGNVLTVTNTPGAVINWQSFSIASQEITRFLQQSAASTVLNRVVGVNPSTILGTLQSNGRVFLINPNGIAIGKGATIDVAGFLASTLNLSDADFLAGRYRFTQSTGTGSVVNQGTINTPTGGMVYLVGQNVENQGIIKSPKGEILLAAGKSIELVDAGTPEIRVQITAPDNQVLNLGQLLASGGRIGMYGGLVRQAGVANANTAVVGENGKIVFKAVKDVKLEAGSATTASGPTAGSIKVEAETGKASTAGTVEANATAGRGGNIDISGQQGVTVEPAGRISANGTEGGSIALASSAGSVQVAGQVSADANAGRGGQVAVVAAARSTVSSTAIVSANGPQGGGTVSVKAVDSAGVDAGGVIQANGASGGTVTISADQGSIDIGGTIEATGSDAQGGAIQVAALNDVTLGDTSILAAYGRRGGEARIEAREGMTLGSGAIDASGKDGPGGKVQLFGPQVGLVREATINVSGKTGGGTALVGGDYQGKNPDVPNARRTYVGSDVLITADAIEAGNGGKVIIWADGDTRFFGQISARGGTQSGDGGFVEVSGKENLTFAGRVALSSPYGKGGTLLLDPGDLYITTTGAPGAPAVTPQLDAANPFTAPADTKDYYAEKATIEATDGNVILLADQNVFFQASLNMAKQGSGESISVTATNGKIDFGSKSITTAGGDILLSAKTDISAIGGLDAGAGNVTMTAGGTVSQTGDIKGTTLTLKGAGAVYTLENGGNAITTLDAKTDQVGNFSFRDDDGFGVAGIDSSGTVTLQTGSGKTVNQTGDIKGTTLTLKGAGAVYTLGNSGNRITTLDADDNQLGNLNFRDDNGFAVTGVDSSGTITLKSIGGGIDLNGAIKANGAVDINSTGVLKIDPAGDINSGNGTVSLTGSSIDTAGDVTTTNKDVTFNSPTKLTGNVTVDAGSGNVTFSNTINGGFDLSVKSSGTTKFSGTVGNTTPLAKLTTDNVGGTTINTTSMKTSGDMLFSDPVTLSASATLTTTGGGNISFGNTINADDAAANDRTLTLNSGAGTISVTGTIGNTQALAGLTITNSNGATFANTVTVNDGAGAIAVSDTAGAKTVEFQNDLTAKTFTASNGGNAYNVSFLGASTKVNSSATFGNSGALQVGDQTADVTSIAGGITHTAGPTVFAGDITVTGPMSVNATTLVSGQTTTINAGANDVTFNTTLDGPGALIVNSSGNTVFTGVVGGITPLSSLQTNAGGTTKVNGGFVTTDGAGGITFGDGVTFSGTTTFATNGSSSTGSNISFDQTATGPGGAANLTLDAGSTGNVTALGVVSGIQNLTVTADNVNMAGGIVHTVNNAVTFNSTGDVNYAQNGNLNIGLSNVAGAANITANNGSIVTGGAGAGFTAGSVTLTATDGAGTDVGTLTVGAGGITTTGGSLVLKSADSMTIGGPLNSNNGTITLIAGNAPGMASLGIAPAANANPGGALGSVQINAPVQAGTGNVTIYSTGPVSQALPGTDAGVQTKNALTVRTYNDNAGAATITMENDKQTGGVTCATGNTGTGNCATQITLETRQAGDTGLGSTTSFPGGFAASEIRYKSISGTQIIGIGTASDVLLEADSWTLNAGAINGGNVNIVATGSGGGGNINVGIAIPTSFINNNLTGGSLNLRAARDITIQPGGSIGTQGSRFDHNLVLAAGDDISIQGSIFLNGDLNLRANATAGDLNGNAPLFSTGTVTISTPGTTPVEVLAKNITIGDAARPVNALTMTAGTAGTGQSADAVLKADSKLGINTSGNLSATAGTATASVPSGTPTTADVLLSGSTVEVVVGGNLDLEAGSSTITGGAAVQQEAHANSKLEGTVVSLMVSGNAAVTGGTATAAGGGNTATSSASIVSSASLSPVILGDLTIAGGTSLAQPVAGQSAVADTSTEIRTGGDLMLRVGRDLIISGGAAVASTALGGASATADSGAQLAAQGVKDIQVTRNFNVNGGSAATTGSSATATSIAGLDAGQAAATSVTLKVSTGGDLSLLGGTELGNALASAAILSAGEIKLFINGPTGLTLGGGSGSDLFQLVGPTLISLEGKGYPITVQGNFDANGALVRGDAFIISGAPPLNLDSLLAAFLRTTDCVTFSGGSCTVPGSSSARAAETTKSQAGAGVCK